MADKYWWEEYEEEDKKKQGNSQQSGTTSYWWDNIGNQAGTNIANRVNTWLKNHDTYVRNYQGRYAGRKFDYSDSYVSDSAKWLDTVSKQADAFEAERQSILAYMDQYKSYLNEEWMNDIRKTLASGSYAQQQIRNSATQDNDYWNSFGSDADLVTKYGSAEGVYQYAQRADGYNTKYTGMGLNDLNAALNALEDGEEKDWLAVNMTPLAKETLSKNADWAERSKYKSTYRGGEQFNAWAGRYTDTGFDDITYDYINRDKTAMGRYMVNSGNDNTSLFGLDKSYLEEMTDDEIAVYNYLYDPNDKTASDAYLAMLLSDLNYRQRKNAEEYWSAYAKEHPVGSSVFSVLMSPTKVLSAIGQFADYSADGTVDQNAGYNKFSYIPTAIRTQVGNDIATPQNGAWGKVGSWTYQLGMSMGDFLMNTAITGGSSALSLTLMGSGAMADTVISAKDRGLSDDQAMILGVIAGGAEIFTEKVSLDALFKGDMTRGVMKYILTNAFTEGTEEVGSSLINLFADIFVSKDKSEWQMQINDYLAKNPKATYEQAFQKVFVDTALSLGLDFLGGALMGGTMGAGGVGFNYITNAAPYIQENKDALKKYGDKTDALIQEGLESDKKSDSYYLANKYQQQVQGKDGKEGKPMTGYQIRQLLAANAEQITPKDMKLIQKAAEKRLTDLGQTEDVSRLAELATKYATGQKLTRAEKYELSSSDYGSRVANELTPKNIESGEYTTGWAEDIGTKEVNAKAYNKTKIDQIRAIIEQMQSTEDPAQYKSLTERAGTEGRFGVSESGKATIRSTGEEIDINSLDVATVSDGELTFKVGNREVSAGDIDFVDDNQSFLVSAVANIENITAKDATAIIHDVVDMDKPLGLQLNGIDEAFTYGFYGYSVEDLKAGMFSKNLTNEQLMSAYELGKAARKDSRDTKVENFKKMRTAADAIAEKGKAKEARNLSITYNHGGGKVVSIEEAGITDAKQSGAVEVAKILHKLGLGTRVEFFSSYETDNGRVFLDDAGVEKKAYSGLYREADGTIRVDLNAYNGRGLTLNALAHELTHFIQQWSETKYKVLVDFLMETYEKTDMNMHERVLREQKRLENIRGKEVSYKEVSYKEAYDEVVANAMMKMFDDGKLVERLTELKAKDKNLAQKLWEGFKKILAKFLGIYEKEGALFKDTADLMEMKETFEQLQNMFAEALVEASENYQASLTPGVEGTTFNAKGEAVAHSTKDGTIQLSMHTYETEGKKALHDYLKKCVSSNKLTKAEMNEMIKGIEDIYQTCKEFKDKYAPFSTWSDAAVVRDTHGRPVFSVVTPNGDYKMNLDFSLVCKKRRTLDAVFNEMSKRGIIDDFELGQKSVVKINEIIRRYGFETACALCFVDAKRFRQASMADSFTRLYNELVESLVPEDKKSSISYFNFSGYETIKDVENGIDTWDNSKLDFSHINHVLKTYESGTVEYKTAKYIKSHAEGRKLLLRGDFMSSSGFDAVKTRNPDVLKLYNSKKGTGGPKAAFGDVQYMNEIIKKARWWTPAKAYSVGGVRVQSFSDYVPRMVFDYVQMVYDLAATKLPAHAYTKEALFVKQFGLTGIKINMSLIPAIAKNGIAPGLDANGNYVWAGESFDYETAKDIQNADGYTENCGTICVGVSYDHIVKLLNDPNIRMVIPYHKSGLNPIVAHMNQIAEFHDYTNDQRTKGKDGKAVETDFDFSKALHDMGENANPKAVADQYLKWCATKGYTPRFAEFAMEDNYYKLLEDFTLYDKEGNYVPQREVRAVFPTDDSAFGSMKSLIKEGLQEDAVIEGKRDKMVPEIVDEIQKSLPKTEAEIDETQQVKQADHDLEAVEMQSSQETDADNAPTFYSQMAKVVDGMKQEKFGASSVVSMLRGRGVKAEEIKWSGIEAFLEGKKSVTKAELQEFIAGSMLQIEEKVLDGKNKVDPVVKRHSLKEFGLYVDDKLIETFTKNKAGYWSPSKRRNVSLDGKEEMVRYGKKLFSNKPQWSKYILDGGNNYREILFNLPGSTYSNGAMTGHWGKDAHGILAHARVQDFEVDGKKMLFVEEIQSDWHNEGHKGGYLTKEESALDSRAASNAVRDLEREMQDYLESKNGHVLVKWYTKNYDLEYEDRAYGRLLSMSKHDFNRISARVPKNIANSEVIGKMAEYTAKRDELIDEADRIYAIVKDRAADAPFKENYHEFVLKSLLRQAAENGYDSIGWTTADIQSERWSDQYAEGYRIEYDQDIPKFLKKYGKQWGATVGSTTLNNGNEVWSMDITDAMKQSVLKEGQAMYSSNETDADYMDAVNRGDMVTAQRMVNEAAKAAGVIMNENGRKPLSLYRGTPNFGRTVFKSPVIFTTTSQSVSAGYGGNKGYARQRLISERYTQDDGSTETLIKNAKNVLGWELSPYDEEKRNEIHENTRSLSDELSSKVNDVWTGEAIDALPGVDENLDNTIAWVLSLAGSINENIDDFGSYVPLSEIESWIDKFDEHLPKFREYLNQHRSELKDTAAWPMFQLVMGYELSDFAIDARYKFLRSFEDDLLVSETGSLVSAETVRDQVETLKDIGSYHLYGLAGNKPLVIDGKGAMWHGIHVEQWGGYFTTDSIVKRAQEEGYTSVCIKNINDVAMNNYSANVKSDIYAFFDRNQVKSADPVTYDDKGNVIPLSERFNTEKDDIRYSEHASNADLAEMDDTALYIKNTDKANYIDMIFNGAKTEETRSRRTLDAFVGKDFYVTDGKYVYGSIVLGEPHKYTEAEFHKKENQLKHRVPVGDKYDIKPGGTKWAYPIESYKKFDQPKKLSDSKEYKNSFQARQVRYSGHETDYSNRDLLANAFEGLSQNSEEYKMIQEYKSRVKDLNAQEAKLSELNALIRQLTSGNVDVNESMKRRIAGLVTKPSSETSDGDIIPNGAKVRATDRGNIGVVRGYNSNSGQYTVAFRNKDGLSKTVQLSANLIEPLRSKKAKAEVVRKDGESDKSYYKRLLVAEAEMTADSINKQDKKLLSMEASEPLRKVIEQERKKEALKTIDHVKEIQQNKKLRAEQTELRHKIRKAVRDLDKLLNRGNKKTNVKEDMKDFVSKALEIADYLFTDHISNDELIRRGINPALIRGEREARLVKETEEIIAKLDAATDINQPGSKLTDEEFTRLDAKRKANEDKLRDLLTAQRNERLNTPVSKLFDDLVKAYASLKNSSQDAVKAAYNEELEKSLRAFMSDDSKLKILENMRVADMTTEELNWLYRAYTMVLTNVRNANKVFVKSKIESIDKAAEKLTSDFSKRKAPDKKLAIVSRNIANKIGWDYEKLYYALDRIGSETFTELVMNIANSENIVMQDVIEAVEFRDKMVEKYGFNNWDVNKEIDREFLDNTGKKFKMTLGQLMALYAYSRREGAWDHIEYGGFVFGKAALTNPKPADSYKLSKEQCETLTNLLTNKQKGYVEAMQKFLSENMGEKGNEVSMMLYGIKMFNEKNYFPIKIAGQFKAQANESQAQAAAGFATMSNAGFTHAQNPNAKAPFVLEGFNDIWADHVNEMSRYHGTVPALEDFRRVMNRSSYSDVGAESMALWQLMENSYGEKAKKYFQNLYREANSGAITDKLQETPRKLLSMFRKNSVAYSLSVLVQQPASVVRAYAMIPKKYFGIKGFGTITSGVVKAVSDKWTKAHTNAYNEMLKYAPGVTLAKEIGGFDTHTGGSIRSYLLDTNKKFGQKWKTGTALEKGKAVMDLVDDNAIANLPNLADKIAWIEIWNACKREAVARNKNLAPNSEEFMQAVGERFTEVIRATQVYDSMFAKSPLLKSKNLAVQYLVSFMNEPNTVANMTEKAVRDATRGDWKSGVKTAAVVIHSIVFTNLLKSIVYAMRDDDEDESYTEKYIEAVAGNLLDDFNALNYIPLVRDAWSLAQGYDVERADMAIVADSIDALSRVIKNATTETDDMTEEQLVEFDKKVTEANWKLVESIASFFGIPIKNVRREVNGILDHARIAAANAGTTTAHSAWEKFSNAIIDSIPFMSTNSKQDKLYDAILSGDTEYVSRLKAGYKDEDSYNSAVRKALRENDPRIHEAALAYYNGNLDEYKRIFKEIRNDDKQNIIGFDNTMEAVMSEVSSIKGELEPKDESSAYNATDFVNALLVGSTDLAQTMKEDIISYKVDHGSTRIEAEVSFNSSVATSTRNAFDSGLLDEAGTEKMLQEYAGMDEEEASEKTSYWSFIKAHPQYRGELSQSNVEDYHEFAEPAEIPLDVFAQYVDGTKGLKTIRDEWGDEVKSKREQVLEVIDSLPLTWQQKDALYLAAEYAESEIWNVPW